jgi:hypothetical protein
MLTYFSTAKLACAFTLNRGGDEMQKKLITAALLTLFLGATLMATVAAQPEKPLRLELEMDLFFTDPLHWEGTVTGDIEGDIVVTEGMPTFPGKTEHFFETFVITTSGGDTIEGYDEGVWSFQTFKWRANGRVTIATGIWADMVGCKVHEIGMTTPLGEEVAAWGTITVVHG